MNESRSTIRGNSARPEQGLDPPQTIRVALVGCGAIAAQMHLPVLAGHRTLKLSALVDRDQTRARHFAEGYGVPIVLDDAAKLSRELVDAAIIATPPSHHAPCALDLMKQGIHVLVEKPMATTLADAEAMVNEANRAGVVLAVGFFRRTFPSIGLMKSLLDSGWVGRPGSFLVEGGGMYNWSAATLGNMRRDLAGGGVLIDFGAHMVDLMFALFDEPADILRYSDNSRGGIESDCTIDLEVRHAGEPVRGRIEMARTRELESFIRVECERATLEFRVTDRFGVKVSPRDVALVDPTTGLPRGFSLGANWQDQSQEESWYATFGRQLDDWSAAIQTGREPALSGRSALATTRLIEACYRDRQVMDEPWVSRGTLQSDALAPSLEASLSNGLPKPPNVHVQSRASRLLVTGASGFIGCRVVELLRLREQCDVRAVVHNPANASRLARLDVEMVQADLASAADVQRLAKDCRSVIHCAIGTTYGEPQKIASVTVGGTRQLARAALAAGVERFVHVSSMSVYGNAVGANGVITESQSVAPGRHDSYGASKAAAERAVFECSKAGLSAVVVRPARVFGPFSRTFVMGPLRAIAAGNFAWLGSPDVPADLVYVDNVAEALLAAVFANPDRVSGEAFNIGAGSGNTWREFYSFFAEQLGYDSAAIPVVAGRDANGQSAMSSLLSFPSNVVRGIGEVVTSSEFKSLGRRVLATKPIGTMPRTAIDRFPAFERGLRKVVRADDTLPVYQREIGQAGHPVCMGSNGVQLSNEKLRDRLMFVPPVSSDDARQLTLDWIRHARIV